MPFAHAGELAALATAFCWTITAMAFESAGRRIGSLPVNLIRLLLAFLLLSVFCWATRSVPLPTDASTHAWFWLAMSGVVGFTVGDLCLFQAFVMIGARTTMLMFTLTPPLTAVIGWLVMGERLTYQDWAGMALTVGGVAWVVLERKKDDEGRQGRLPLAGVLLGLGGAAGQAVGLVLSKYGMRDYNPFAATQIRVIAGIVGFALLFIFIGWWPKVFASLKDRGAMARTSLGAFFGPFLGVSLSLVALKYTQAGVAATIMALTPVMIIPPAMIVFKEHVSVRAVLGALVAVAGTALLFL